MMRYETQGYEIKNMKLQEHLKDSSNWRLASLLDLKIVCQDGILFWNTLLIASLSPMLNALLQVKWPLKKRNEFRIYLC